MRFRFVNIALLGTAACVASSPVWAQDADIEQVVVSASRINLVGYTQPTPVTSVSTETLERDAHASLGDMFRTLPSFAVTNSPDTSTGQQGISGSTSGSDQVNLRDLGATRTLTLLNNTRVVPVDAGGGTDLTLFPNGLIKRIDVVTGGASAAWGSDAVAGVVNIIMDNNFEGLKGNLEVGTNQWMDKQKLKLSASWGASFLGGRLHQVFDASYTNLTGTAIPSNAKWDNFSSYILNPDYTATNGQPQYLTKRRVGLAFATRGGVIISGPLKGIQFVGPQGTPEPFNFGIVTGILSWGGSALTSDYNGQENIMSDPERTVNFYSDTSFEVSDALKIGVELDYGRLKGQNVGYSYLSQNTVKIDNAFLDPTIVTAMTSAKITTFVLGTTNTNNLPPQANSNLGPGAPVLGELQDFAFRSLHRAVVRLDGTVFGDWTWNITGQASKINKLILTTMPNLVRYQQAIDAVRVTTANQGTSGLPLGSIQCRSLLTPATADYHAFQKGGCQPLNTFGDGVASQAAMNYIKSRYGEEFTSVGVSQTTASFSFTGQPFTLPAGKMAVAAGFDYRLEGVNESADPESTLRNWLAGNRPTWRAYNYTTEGFGEIDAPLLKDMLVQSLDFSAAGRIVDYRTSGMVETWKLGLTSQVNDDVRLRLTWSTDIRAPSLTDLFNPGSTSNGTAAVPGQINANGLSGGNPNLVPETALGITGGVVLSPHWFPGLNISADWYSINIKGVITSVSSAQIVAGCVAGIQVYCAQYVYATDGRTNSQSPTGKFVTNVATSPINGASQTVSGLDFQADYSFDFWNGTVNSNLTASYTDEAVTKQSGPLGETLRTGGSLSQDAGGNGRPKLQGKLSLTYDEDPWSFTVQSRFRGSAHVNNRYGDDRGGPLSVDDNNVPWVGYIDLRGSYSFGDHFQVYGGVDNFMDIPPPEIPSLTGTSSRNDYGLPTRSDIYDTSGRAIRAGIRFKY